MDHLKKGHHKHSKTVIGILTILCIILGLLELSTFYTGIINNEVNILLTLILFVLFIDNYIHFTHHKQNRRIYIILSIIFLILTISHLIRQIAGPIFCNLDPIFSIYLYEGFAVIFGIFMIYSSILFVKFNRKLNYHSASVGIVGIIIAVNHIIKMFVGVCV